MGRNDRRSGTIVSAMLFACLLLAQTGSFAHTFEHDPGSVGDTACATCISLSQLGAATVDSGLESAVEVFQPVQRAATAVVHAACAARVVRQRGPPESP